MAYPTGIAPVGVQVRQVGDRPPRYRGSAYVLGTQRRGPWRRALEEAVQDREAILANRPLTGRETGPADRFERQDTLVYFIQAGTDGPIKVGLTSGDPRLRLSCLQTAHYRDLRLLGARPGGELLERILHDELAEHHIRGEWFRPHPEVLAVARETA